MRRTARKHVNHGMVIPDYGAGWNPTKVTRPNLMDCWYPAWAAGGTNTFTAVPAITIWKDMGPWGQDLTATLGSTSPELERTVALLNGRPAVKFASTDIMRGPEKVGAPTGGDKTIVTVILPVTGGYIFGKGLSDSDEEWAAYVETGYGYYDSGGGSAYVEGGGYGTSDVGHVVSFRNSGGTHVIRRDGTQVGSASRSSGIADSAGDITLGRCRQTVGSYVGKIAEAMCWRTVLSDTDLLDVERRLGRYYGITVA